MGGWGRGDVVQRLLLDFIGRSIVHGGSLGARCDNVVYAHRVENHAAPRWPIGAVELFT